MGVVMKFKVYVRAPLAIGRGHTFGEAVRLLGGTLFEEGDGRGVVLYRGGVFPAVFTERGAIDEIECIIGFQLDRGGIILRGAFGIALFRIGLSPRQQRRVLIGLQLHRMIEVRKCFCILFFLQVGGATRQVAFGLVGLGLD